ncbi:hypothetical protein [Mesobacillus zeae]|uniref:Uncharacterized protein n=1 Tax=Mesobacillus zeae TaxID=1917180 RepID=A0A398BE37_9BACI|nr:hypothetical protein [Mesobacillus zeae]RID85846.1 hypothetical protein D1970_09990 [Mesobacillus zeae]
MDIAIMLVALIIIVSLLATIALTGKSDSDYRGSSRSNTMRLSAIYAVVIISSIVGLALYIKF